MKQTILGMAVVLIGKCYKKNIGMKETCGYRQIFQTNIWQHTVLKQFSYINYCNCNPRFLGNANPGRGITFYECLFISRY